MPPEKTCAFRGGVRRKQTRSPLELVLQEASLANALEKLENTHPGLVGARVGVALGGVAQCVELSAVWRQAGRQAREDSRRNLVHILDVGGRIHAFVLREDVDLARRILDRSWVPIDLVVPQRLLERSSDLESVTAVDASIRRESQLDGCLRGDARDEPTFAFPEAALNSPLARPP